MKKFLTKIFSLNNIPQFLLPSIKIGIILFLIPMVVILSFWIKGYINEPQFIISIIFFLAAATIFVCLLISDLINLTKNIDNFKNSDKSKFFILKFAKYIPDKINNIYNNLEQQNKELQTALTENTLLFDTLPETILMLNKKLKIVRANKAAILRFGSHIINNNLNFIISDESEIKKIKSKLKNKNSTEKNKLEIRILKDKVERHYNVRARKFPVFSNYDIDSILVLNDITESKRTKQMMKDFVANASHEIRTPLTSILGFIETLQTTAKDDIDARELFLKIMAEQTEHMKTIVSDLLSLSRIETHETEPITEETNILDLINIAIDGTKLSANAKNMNIIKKTPTKLPIIKGDSREMTQVISNLISNAIKYGYENSNIEINAKKTIDKNKKYILISVKNSGDGIEKKDIPKLTQRFYRSDSVRSQNISGAGLGLAIVKHILNRHNGDLIIESKPKKFTKFTVKLPYEDSH